MLCMGTFLEYDISGSYQSHDQLKISKRLWTRLKGYRCWEIMSASIVRQNAVPCMFKLAQPSERHVSFPSLSFTGIIPVGQIKSKAC